MYRDNSGLGLACAIGASQKFVCAIFKDCAPCYHRSQIFADNTPNLDFWCHLVQLKIKDNRVSRRKARKFFHTIFTNRYFSYFN